MFSSPLSCQRLEGAPRTDPPPAGSPGGCGGDGGRYDSASRTSSARRVGGDKGRTRTESWTGALE